MREKPANPGIFKNDVTEITGFDERGLYHVHPFTGRRRYYDESAQLLKTNNDFQLRRQFEKEGVYPALLQLARQSDQEMLTFIKRIKEDPNLRRFLVLFPSETRKILWDSPRFMAFVDSDFDFKAELLEQNGLPPKNPLAALRASPEYQAFRKL